MPLDQVAAWFTQRGDLGEILDRRNDGPREPLFVSEHADSFLGATRGYGAAAKPDDYLQAFADFIKSKSNDIPALVTVVTRPRELTRAQLRQLMLELDKAGFSEANLHAAWHQKTNQEIAARIVGYIRQAALGDPLVPFAERVDHALAAMLASRPWTTPQREWLKKLAAQTKANQLVDRAALDDADLIFKREGGGFARLNKLFGGQLDQLVQEFNEAVWRNPA
jgi:type I restriction enzyme R subunit